MAYGSDSTYATSPVKGVVDSWATSKFNNGELKTVSNYSARLITYDEIMLNFDELIESKPCGNECGVINYIFPLKWNWMYNSDYSYWTMSSEGSVSIYAIDSAGKISHSYFKNSFALRPVINVYKSAITQ